MAAKDEKKKGNKATQSVNDSNKAEDCNNATTRTNKM